MVRHGISWQGAAALFSPLGKKPARENAIHPLAQAKGLSGGEAVKSVAGGITATSMERPTSARGRFAVRMGPCSTNGSPSCGRFRAGSCARSLLDPEQVGQGSLSPEVRPSDCPRNPRAMLNLTLNTDTTVEAAHATQGPRAGGEG